MDIVKSSIVGSPFRDSQLETLAASLVNDMSEPFTEGCKILMEQEPRRVIQAHLDSAAHT